MGIFDKIKEVFGGGGSSYDFNSYDESGEEIEIEIELINDEVPVGGFVRGKFTLRGNAEATAINEISIDLIHNHEDYIGTQTVPMLGRTIKKGEVFEQKFSIQVREDVEDVKLKRNCTHTLSVVAYGEGLEEGCSKGIFITQETESSNKQNYNEYHIVNDMPELLHSSVRGELRFFDSTSCLVFSWNDQITVRESNGLVRWKKEGPGRTLALSPDETKLAAFWENEQKIVILDMNNGTELTEIPLEGYVDHLAWLDSSHKLVATTGDRSIKVFSGGGENLQELYLEEIDYNNGLVKVPGEDQVFLTDGNGDMICMLNIEDGGIVNQEETEETDFITLSPAGKYIGLVSICNFHIMERETFATVVKDAFPGKGGMQEKGETDSSRAWETKVRFSPDNNTFVINVRDGQLWIFELESRTYRSVDRELLNYVEDCYWIDQGTLAAIDSEGHFSVVDLNSMKLLMKEKDYQER